jgi:hypothetical protein
VSELEKLRLKIERLQRTIHEVRMIPRNLLTYETLNNTLDDEDFLMRLWESEEEVS